MKEQPNYKADLVQRSSIAAAVRKRTNTKVTNYDVARVARHQGIDAIDKGDHEHYYTKLQAQSITIALMNKIAMDQQLARDPQPAAPSAPSAPAAPAARELTAEEMVKRLRAMGYDVTCTKTITMTETL